MKHRHPIIKNIKCDDVFALQVADIAKSRCKRPHAQREVKHMVPTNSKYFQDMTSASRTMHKTSNMHTAHVAHSHTAAHTTAGDIYHDDTCALRGLLCAAESHQKERRECTELPPFREILREGILREGDNEKLLVTVSFADLLRLHQNQKVSGE